VKVDTIRNMAKPSCKKDVMKLTWMMTALGRFISKLSEKVRTMCGSRTGGWSLPCVMSDWQR
jgi:hypothetical protein